MRLTFYAWQLSYDQRVTLSFLVFNVNGWLKMPNLHLKQLGCRMGSKGVTQCGTALCSDFDLDHSTTLNNFHPFRGFPYLWGGREDRIITWGYASTGCPFPTSRWPWIQPVLQWLLCAPDTVWWHSAPFQTHPLPSFLVVSCTVDSQICAKFSLCVSFVISMANLIFCLQNRNKSFLSIDIYDSYWQVGRNWPFYHGSERVIDHPVLLSRKPGKYERLYTSGPFITF